MAGFQLPTYGAPYAGATDPMQSLYPMTSSTMVNGNGFGSLSGFGGAAGTASPNSWQQMTAMNNFGQGAGTEGLPSAGGMDWGNFLFGSEKDGIKTNGAAGSILGAAGGLMNGYLGLKGLGLAKDTLAFNKDQFNKNYAAQKGVTNSEMSDRQKLRNYEDTANGRTGRNMSTADYMSQYGVA